MVEAPQKRRGPITLICESRKFRLRAALVAAVLIGYHLSLGPAVWVSTRLWPLRQSPKAPIAFKTAFDLYGAPGFWVADNMQVGADSLLWKYIDWWRNPADRY